MTLDPRPDQTLFEATLQEVQRRLRTARGGDDLLAVATWGARQMSRIYSATDAAVRGQVACRAGCSFCCNVPMAVQAHEIFLVAAHIRGTFSSAAIAAVVEKSRGPRSRLAGIESATYNALFEPCALLEAGKCSIYEARPEVCRAHHSSDPSRCEATIIGTEPTQDHYIIPLRKRMFGVMLGIDQAFVEAGYDGRSYDFTAGVHLALTEPGAFTRWVNKKRAFPDDIGEPRPDDNPLAGEIYSLQTVRAMAAQNGLGSA